MPQKRSNRRRGAPGVENELDAVVGQGAEKQIQGGWLGVAERCRGTFDQPQLVLAGEGSESFGMVRIEGGTRRRVSTRKAPGADSDLHVGISLQRVGSHVPFATVGQIADADHASGPFVGCDKDQPCRATAIGVLQCPLELAVLENQVDGPAAPP